MGEEGELDVPWRDRRLPFLHHVPAPMEVTPSITSETESVNRPLMLAVLVIQRLVYEEFIEDF